ncbi:hypothetical protein C0J50_20748 [Silurus asotus]|uniref:DBF4-type domain-containing protein n=1 Tax=Silurus asotus TaxID=30991 RepID=A0AAD5FL21_SILAS|nr:hypothetical protein C0J50_20748 [Silurus asotus]
MQLSMVLKLLMKYGINVITKTQFNRVLTGNCLLQKVESFLYKEVNVVITGNRDALNAVAASPGKVKRQDPPREDRGNVVQRPGTPRAPLDFVKVEDSSRKYRPLHSQALEFPMLSYTRRFSPFENPAPVHPGKGKDDTLRKEMSRKSDEAISSEDKSSKAPKTSRKKKSLGFCECCHLKYRDQDQHLQSDVHLRFVENVQNYAVVDQLVVEMDAVFSGCKDPHTDAVMSSTASRQWRERGGGIGNGDSDSDGRAHRGGEIAWPQRLQERADPEGGELAHGRLDTRAKTGDADAPHQHVFTSISTTISLSIFLFTSTIPFISTPISTSSEPPPSSPHHLPYISTSSKPPSPSQPPSPSPSPSLTPLPLSSPPLYII